MKILETERLILRVFKKSDAKPLIAINSDAKVMQYFPSMPTESETIEFIDKVIAHQKEHGFSLYAVELKSNKNMIGFVGLSMATSKAHFTPAIEIGWRLNSKYWNMGYASEAAKAVLEYGFNDLGLIEIVSFTSKLNKPSIRVMEKIGLQTDIKDNFNHPNVDKGSPLREHVLYRAVKQLYE